MLLNIDSQKLKSKVAFAYCNGGVSEVPLVKRSVYLLETGFTKKYPYSSPSSSTPSSLKASSETRTTKELRTQPHISHCQ